MPPPRPRSSMYLQREIQFKFSYREDDWLNTYLGYSDRTPTSAVPASSLHAASLLFSRLPKPLFIDGIDRVETGLRSWKRTWKRRELMSLLVVLLSLSLLSYSRFFGIQFNSIVINLMAGKDEEEIVSSRKREREKKDGRKCCRKESICNLSFS